MTFATIPGTEPLRAVLVGAGGMGRWWAVTIAASPDVTLAAWVDLVPDAVDAAIAELGLAPTVVAASLGDALARVEADVVIDAAVPEAHHDVTVEALDRGLAVLGEKPLAATMAEARAMVAAADRTGRLFMVSQSRRYDAGLERFRAALAAVGPLALLRTDFWMAARDGGFRHRMADPLLVDMAIHAFDAARYLTGADPVTVWCDSFNPGWSWFDGDATAVASFELADGARYLYSGSWCADGPATSWNGAWFGFGPGGQVRWDGEHGVEAGGADGSLAVPELVEQPEGPAGSLADFVTALRTGRTPMGEGHDNLVSLAMVHAAVASSRRRAPVALAEVLAPG